MATLKELLEQKNLIEAQIASVRNQEIAIAMEQIRELMAEFAITQEDLFPPMRVRASGGSTAKVAPKYRNPNTGETWTGRGKAPAWIASQDRERFLINPPTTTASQLPLGELGQST